MTKRRLFFAIIPPCDFIASIAPYYEQIEKTHSFNHLRKIPVENQHITVLFLGDVDSMDALRIASLFEERLASFSFSLTCRHLIFAPHLHHPRMLWAEFEENTHFQALFCFLRDKLKTHTHLKEAQDASRIHMTLARFTGAKEITEYKFPCSVTPFRVEKIELLCSHNTEDGTHYERIASYSLCKNTPF